MTLKEQIALGESSNLEFKEARSADSLTFVRTVVAFANGRGGRLLFGVEDGTGRIKGIDRLIVQREMDSITDAISTLCTPQIIPHIMLANVDDKTVIVVDVEAGAHTPYYVKKLGIRKGTFQRIGATTREVEEYTLKALILEGENLSFDKQIVKDKRLGKKELSAVCRLMTDTAKCNCENEGRDDTIKAMTPTRLESMGLLVDKEGVKLPTYALCIIAGLIMPDLMIPKIKCAVFRGTDKTGDFVDHADFDGPLAEQIDGAFQFVKRNLRVRSEFVEDNTVRKDIYELPLVSVREAICNAAFHRCYLEPANSYVALYDDRLEIISPGGLLRGITIEEAKNGYSKIRNRGIAEALVYMHEVENWGGGVARYFQKCAELQLPEPKIEEAMGGVVITFYRMQEAYQVVPSETYAVHERGANIDELQDDDCVTEKPSIGTEKPSIGTEKPSIGTEKTSIGAEKPSIGLILESLSLTMPTKKHINCLYNTLGHEEVFGRSRVMKITGLSYGPAGDLLNTMRSKGLLEPVAGQGKGKSRFKK